MFLTLGLIWAPPPDPIKSVQFCGDGIAANGFLLKLREKSVPEQLEWTVDREFVDGLDSLDCTYSATRVCTEDGAICYRTLAEDTIEQSTDGGQSWTVAWSGRSRRYFRHRLQNRPGLIVRLFWPKPEYPVVTGPTALSIKGDANEHALLAAMGTNGILYRHETDEWSDYGALGNDAPRYPKTPRGNYSQFGVFVMLLVGWSMHLLPELSILAGLVYLTITLTERSEDSSVIGRSLPLLRPPDLEPFHLGFLHRRALFISLIAAGLIGFVFPLILVAPTLLAIGSIGLLQVLFGALSSKRTQRQEVVGSSWATSPNPTFLGFTRAILLCLLPLRHSARDLASRLTGRLSAGDWLVGASTYCDGNSWQRFSRRKQDG